MTCSCHEHYLTDVIIGAKEDDFCNELVGCLSCFCFFQIESWSSLYGMRIMKQLFRGSIQKQVDKRD